MNSPFAHVLNTNYVPDGPSREAIRKFIATPIIELSHLDDEIALVKASYDKLLAKREELSKMIDSHHALLSPARGIPPELIKAIFILCLPEERNSAMSSLEAPVLLGRICSTWRQISLTTPQLWSSFHIVAPHRYLPDSEERLLQRLGCVQMWLSRSGVCPLSISLFVPGLRLEDHDAMSILVESLVSFSRRWRHIDFHSPPATLRAVAALRLDDVPLLETLKLHFDTRPLPLDGFNSGNHPILRAPRLLSVSLYNVPTKWRELSINWSRLTEICLDGAFSLRLNVEEALNTLDRLPKLTTCILHLKPTNVHDATMPRVTPVVLPSLQTLRLADCHNLDFRLFFDNIVAPMLRELQIGAVCNRQVRLEHVPFLSLLQSPSSVIDTIGLSTESLREEAVWETLTLAPSLIRLKLQDPENDRSMVNDKFLSRLTPTESDNLEINCLGRNLEVLELKQSKNLSDEALLNMIQERARFAHRGIARFRRVDVNFRREMEMDILPALRPLCDAGLAISLHYATIEKSVASPWTGLVGG